MRNLLITWATLRKTDMKLTENPVWVKSVLKAIPKLSPQLVMQNALNVIMKNVCASLSKPQARTARIEKTIQLMISNGVVSEM